MKIIEILPTIASLAGIAAGAYYYFNLQSSQSSVNPDIRSTRPAYTETYKPEETRLRELLMDCTRLNGDPYRQRICEECNERTTQKFREGQGR